MDMADMAVSNSTDTTQGGPDFSNFSVTDEIEHGASQAIQDAMEEIPRDAEREFEQFAEDVECWWADRYGGDGFCEKRDRRQREDACY